MENKNLNTSLEKTQNESTKKNLKEFMRGMSKRLSKEDLREKIVNFLDERKICSLATCQNNIPRSTPVRYRNKELTIYISTEGGGKMKNIKQNPNVSASIYADYKGFDSCRSVQVWGRAEIITPEDKEKYLEARKIINTEGRGDIQQSMKDMSKDLKLRVIKIDIKKARYFSWPERIFNQSLDLSE